jgi:hypothetical protein
VQAPTVLEISTVDFQYTVRFRLEFQVLNSGGTIGHYRTPLSTVGLDLRNYRLES